MNQGRGGLASAAYLLGALPVVVLFAAAFAAAHVVESKEGVTQRRFGDGLRCRWVLGRGWVDGGGLEFVLGVRRPHRVLIGGHAEHHVLVRVLVGLRVVLHLHLFRVGIPLTSGKLVIQPTGGQLEEGVHPLEEVGPHVGEVVRTEGIA